MAYEVKKLSFPLCTQCCRIIEELGASECESVCPEKFDKDGNPIKGDTDDTTKS